MIGELWEIGLPSDVSVARSLLSLKQGDGLKVTTLNLTETEGLTERNAVLLTGGNESELKKRAEKIAKTMNANSQRYWRSLEDLTEGDHVIFGCKNKEGTDLFFAGYLAYENFDGVCHSIYRSMIDHTAIDQDSEWEVLCWMPLENFIPPLIKPKTKKEILAKQEEKQAWGW